ncbi:hypothetical protein BN1708_020406, partial [Verticillium longisporum]
GAHPPRHAGQDPPALPPNPHSRSQRGRRVHVAQQPARLPRRLPLRRRPHHPRSRDRKLRGHCQPHHPDPQGRQPEADRLRVAHPRARRGHPG